jgi:class 3 adenylate cyclase
VGKALERYFGESWGIRSLDGYAEPGSSQNRVALARFAVLMAGGFVVVGSALLILIWATGREVPGLDIGRSMVVGSVAVGMVPPVWVVFRRAPLGAFHLLPLFATAVLVEVGLSVGPQFETAVVLGMAIIAVVVTVSMRLRVALLHLAHVGIGYAIVLGQEGVRVPLARWVGTMGGSLIIAAVVEHLVGRTRALAMAERASSEAAQAARSELAELNHTLEARVHEQVADLERLGELQRFLPAPVVDAVLSGAPELLEHHRGEIAVLVCDLHGFAALASGAQPEEVHELLDAYFAVLGRHAQRHGATVGAFSGGGLMAFFNDPLPVPDPACRAVQLALDLQAPVSQLLSGWRRVGHDIGFGVGIALGYANIGMIGFEGRRDYTALGPVVNLAAGICAEAPAGGILLDKRAGLAVEGLIPVGEPHEVSLRGFDWVIEAVPVLCPHAL